MEPPHFQRWATFSCADPKSFFLRGGGSEGKLCFPGMVGVGGGGVIPIFGTLLWEIEKKNQFLQGKGCLGPPPPFHAPDQRMISSQWSAPQCSLKFSFSNHCILNYDIKKSQWLHTIVLAIYKSWLFPGRKSLTKLICTRFRHSSPCILQDIIVGTKLL